MIASSRPTPDELVERARSMVPILAARAAEAEAARDIAEETIDDLRQAGFFRMLQPARWGGYEMDPQSFFRVQLALSEGCMSTGWVFGVLGGHAYQLALFPDAAQREVWGDDSATLVCSSYQPAGRVERVPGGFRLRGRWGFSSGCRHCAWVLLGALVPSDTAGGAAEMRTFLLPRRDYRIEDDWHVFGLSGTGSHGICVDDAFVPEHRTHRAVDGFLCDSPGQIENDAPLYRLPWAQIFVRVVSTASIGAARGAVNAAVEIARLRVSASTGKTAASDPVLLNAIARAEASLDEMATVLEHNMADLMRLARSGEAISIQGRALYRYQSAGVAKLCADLVDDLMPLLGAGAIYLSSPIVRYWKDLNAARAHVANNPNSFGPDLAQGLLGESPALLFL